MKKRHGLTRALGACALTLAIFVTGCGNAETAPGEAPAAEETTTQAPSEEETDNTQGQEVVLPEELSAHSETTKAIALGEEPPSSEGLEELPPLNDENFRDLGATDGAMAEADPETLKGVSSRCMVLTSGGVTMQIPSSWLVSQDEDGFVFQDRNESFTGYLYYIDKGNANVCDLEEVAESLPVEAVKDGYTNVRVGTFNRYYSSRDTLCGVSVTYSGDMNGNTYVFYTKLIESKSYINFIEAYGEIYDFGRVASEVEAAFDSVEFVTGESI